MSEILYNGRLLKKTKEMPRVSRVEFAANLEGYLERVSSENLAFVIADEGKPNLVACPAAWFSYCFDGEFGRVVVCAVQYALGCDSIIPGTVCDFIRKNLPVIDNNTLNQLIEVISERVSHDAAVPQTRVWELLLRELNDRKAYIEKALGGIEKKE